jgi:serine/threonine protein kinase/tetratricopeptide (TPR) repeat protein
MGLQVEKNVSPTNPDDQSPELDLQTQRQIQSTPPTQLFIPPRNDELTHAAIRMEEREIHDAGTAVTATAIGLPPIEKTQDGKGDPTSPELHDTANIPFVSGFEVIEELGRGGMGVVYKAREFALNRIVALKMVHLHGHPTAEELIRFRLEAEIAARVRHPNVVQIFETGTWQAKPYLVLEWVPGGTLASYLKRVRVLPPRHAAKLISILARAVHHAHSNGVVHRDLKPGNVLLAKMESPGSATTRVSPPIGTDGTNVPLCFDGEWIAVVPKVTDFGLAKLISNDVGMTETGRVMGTPEYMSPEQAAGRNREIGPASDIHALGVMLYQLLVGDTPFRGENTYAVVKKVIEEEAKSIRSASVVSAVPSDLETVCMKCLRKNPTERYESAAAFADDLDAILSGRPITARPVGPLERSWKFVKRNPAFTALSASIVLAVLAGVAGVGWQWRKTIGERNRAVAAEKDALRQQKTSEAVNRFLVEDLISAAAPDRAQGRTVTVQDALDEAATRLAFAFPDQPEIEAGVRSAIGESYRKLGKPAIAEPMLRSGLAGRITTIGSDHPDTFRTAKELAVTLDDAGRWPEAETLLREWTDRAIQTIGMDQPVTLELRSALGLSLQVHGRSDEALSLLTGVVSDRIRMSGADHAETLRAMNDLGLVHYERKDIPEARTWISQALQGRERTLGPNHPDTLESANNLAAVFEAEGNANEAGKLLEGLVERSQTVRGEHHIDTLSAINNFGRMLYRQKRFAEAALKYQAAMDKATQAPGFGPTHPVTLKFRHNLGTAQFALRRFSDADATFETVYRIRKTILPLNHPDTLQTGHDWGTLRVLAGRPAEAISILADTFQGRKAVRGLGHIETVQTTASWAQAVLSSRRTGPQLKEMIATINDVIAASNDKSPAMNNLISLARQLADRESASEAYAQKWHALAGVPAERFAFASEAANRAVAANDMAAAVAPALDAIAAAKQLPENERQPRLTQAWLLAGQAAMAANQFATAEPPLRELYEQTKRANPDSFDFGVAANLLGRCLAAQKRFPEAEPLLLQGFELIRTKSKPGLTEANWTLRIVKAKADILEAYEDGANRRT